MEALTLSTGVETITPRRASEMLATSAGNRNLKSAKVKSYARDMIAGRWMLNGETIIFDEEGVLIDGHHRLTACIQSDVAIRSAVIRGVRRSSRVTVDMGASRSIRDVLTLNGHGNANVVHSVIVALMSLAAGLPRVANPSSQEVLNFVETYPFVTECCPEGIRKALPRSGAIMGAIEFVARLNGEEDTFAEFANVLKSGVPAYPDCAAHALRERIMRDSMARNHMALRDVHRVAVAAWEKFRRQQPAKFLRVPDEYKITGWPQ